MKASTQRKNNITLAGFISLAIGLALAPGSVQAQSQYCGLYLNQDGAEKSRTFSSCWYGAIGLGVSHVDPEGTDGNGWYTASDGNSSTGWNVFVGKRFAPKWFAELKYVDLGAAELTTSNVVFDQQYPDASITYKAPSLMLGYYLFKPRDGFNVFAKAGVSAVANEKENDGGTVLFEAVESVQVVVGAGVQYDFRNSPWLLKLEVDSYDRDALYAGISIGRYFGGRTKPLVKKQKIAAKKTKKSVTPAPIPTSTPKSMLKPEQPVAAITPCKKLNVLSEDVQFETNSAVLTPASKSFLDSIAQGLVCQPDTWLEVQAHTDSDGSENYNLKLSNKRAVSVSQYLLDSGVVSCNLIPRGFGESRPVATNATRDGKARNRRVELEVVGENMCDTD